MTGKLLTAVIVYLFSAAVVARIAMIPFAAVSRARVERFARRQSLPITVDNGPVVIDYLATTRRWRGTGLLLVILTSGLYTGQQGQGAHVGFAAVFAGWFVGAVIAEWRVSSRRREEGKRVASLVPRRASDYLPTYVLLVVITAFVAVVALDVDAALRAGGTRDRIELVGWTAATVAILVLVVMIARHVLTRTQLLAASDVLAADDAVRSRSLHVLAGSGLASAGYLLSGAGGVAGRSEIWTGVIWANFATTMGAIVVPLLGLFVATWPYSARRRQPRALGASA